MALKPLKQFGQHFLNDNTIADNIVKAAELQPDDTAWEIGPGKGILTDRILALTKHLTAFEIDFRLTDYLKTVYGKKLNLINRDILGVNWDEYLPKEPGHQVKLISNLPYQITSPVLYAIEKHASNFSRIVLMIQKEVAERLTAKAGSKAYGVLTLKFGYSFTTELLFHVPPTAFEPAPKVHSSVVLITGRLDPPQPKSLDIYRQIIDTAFMQRRKTLRNNLKRMFAAETLTKLESASGIDFNRRGETIDEGEYLLLADCAHDLSGHQ